MKIAVIGTGYVGLVTGACFAEMGNEVICIDVNEYKINQLNRGVMPIYEPGLETIVLKNVKSKNLFFVTEIGKTLKETEVVFIAVGTPMSETNTADLQYVFKAAKEIGEKMQNDLLIVSKSTVPVGTADLIKEIIQEELDKRKKTFDFEIVSNPEFLKEGNAVNDFMKPDRIIIGADSDFSIKKMKELYSSFFRVRDRFITMDVRSAEMTKYAANAMLATKISFINEIANICEKVNADVNKVRIGIGADKRIGYDFIYPGVGYGGTCFPKDIAALIQLGNDNDYSSKLITAVDEVNNEQKKHFFHKITTRFGENLKGFNFGIWGLSFKPETDDMRESPSIYIVRELKKRGADVKVYDPKAIRKAKSIYLKDEEVFYGEDKYEAIENVDALILLTEWKEFRSPDFNKLKEKMRQKIIFDGRNQYQLLDLKSKQFEYYQVGKNI